MKYFSAYKSSEFSITQKQKRREDLFSLVKKQASPNTYKQQAKTVIPRRMVIQTDTALAVHEYIQYR